MRFSSRVDISEPNPIAKAEATAKTAGRPLGKHNDSNPTRHALAPDLVPDIYSADPRGQRYAREALAAFLDMQEIAGRPVHPQFNFRSLLVAYQTAV